LETQQARDRGRNACKSGGQGGPDPEKGGEREKVGEKNNG